MRDDHDFMERVDLDLAARGIARRILQVEAGSSLEDLKRAYRRAAIRYRPDHNDNTPEANRMFGLIKCAYELLAFDKPCCELLVDTDSWSDVPRDDKFSLGNRWGHFCWWREKFFSSEEKRREDQRPSCI